MLDLQALRYFVEVARAGGFTRASQSLHVTQPAVSRMVKSLEDRLGTPLLVRERRRVALTDAGRVVLERAQGVLDALQVLEDEVGELSTLRRGRLRLGLPPIVSVSSFAPLLSAFHRAYPGIQLDLREEGSREIEALVRRLELDVGAVVLPTDEAAFATMPFAREKLRAVVHPGHRLAGRRAIGLAELAGTPLVLYRRGFALHGLILDAFRRSGFEPAVVSESSHWDFMVSMVAADLGTALLPSSLCTQLDAAEVRTIPVVRPAIPCDVALIWRRDRELPPAARAWLELAARFRQDRPR
jgi:DNA-binding transcriptional LysR family regulator